MRDLRFGRWLPLAGGIAAATCLGKVAPVAASVQDAFGLTALWLGAAISAITFVAAACAAPVGEWLRRRDPTLWMVTGLMVMAVAGSVMIVSPGPVALIFLRLAEGAGYLPVMVGGPVMLFMRVAESRRPLALALWGGCIPAGLALGATAGGVIGARLGWQWWFAVVSLACAGLALATFFDRYASGPPWPDRAPLARAPRGRPYAPRRVPAGPLLLAGGFGVVAVTSVAVASLLPEYLRSAVGFSVEHAGVITSVAAAAGVPGTVCAGVLLRRGVGAQALTSGGLMSAVPAALTFGLPVPLAVRVASAVLLLFIVGVAVGAAYGALPAVVRDTDDLPLANGLLVQLGSAGTLVGPPVFAIVTGLQRWYLMPYLVLLTAGLGALLVSRAIATTRAISTTKGRKA